MSVDQICRGYELEISGILLTMDLRVMDMSEFDVILGMDWFMAHRFVIDYDRKMVTPYTPDGNFFLCFKGISTMLYPKSCMTLDGMGS